MLTCCEVKTNAPVLLILCVLMAILVTLSSNTGNLRQNCGNACTSKIQKLTVSELFHKGTPTICAGQRVYTVSIREWNAS
jgi:hypothetical protein